MVTESSTKQKVPFWIEDGTVQIGADTREDHPDDEKKRRERLVKDSKSSDSSKPQKILIPVAFPKRCELLIDVAKSILDEEEGGQIILAHIRFGADKYAKEYEAAESVEEMAKRHAVNMPEEVKIDWVVRTAPTVPRGILDTANDSNCTSILMFTGAKEEDSNIGNIAKEVISGAEIPVLLYRPGEEAYEEGKVRRVVVGTDLTDGSAGVVNIGNRISETFDVSLIVMHVIKPGGNRTQSSAKEDLKALVSNYPDTVTSVVKAGSPGDGIFHESRASDLTILGVRPKSATSTIGYHTTTDLISKLRGPVIVASMPDRPIGLSGFIKRRFRLLRPKMTKTEVADLRWQIRLDTTPSIDYVWMSIFSAAVAVFGLMTDSIPVLIGAMLVAPMMAPMVAIGAALVSGDFITARKGATTTLLGMVAVAVTTYVIVTLVGPSAPTSEMLNRGTPSLLDCGIGIVGGIVGAYTLARPGIPAAASGVAIAAALVPPLVVAAMTVGTYTILSLGSFILFFANVLAIIAASGLTFITLGLTPDEDYAPKFLKGKIWTNVWLLMPILLVAVGLVSAFGLISNSSNSNTLSAQIDEMFPKHIVSVQTVENYIDPALVVRLIGVEPPTKKELDDAKDLVEQRTSLTPQFIYEQTIEPTDSK